MAQAGDLLRTAVSAFDEFFDLHTLKAIVVAKIKDSSALARLPYVNGASWNPKLACLPGTRGTLLSLVRHWSRLRDHRHILCLKGVAGSGKTAIAHAVAQALDADDLLVSSVFFDCANASRNTPEFLFSTIARDIAGRFPAIAADIGALLEKEPALASAHPSRQFEALIAGPLRRHQIDRPIALVIDALDEAIRGDSEIEVLAILRDGVVNLPACIRIFITARPTRIIDQFLSRKEHIASYVLDINSAENRQDVAIYIDAVLRDDFFRSEMGMPWPDEALIRDLKTMADGNFIWIATVFSYLRSTYMPKQKLHALLSASPTSSQVLEPTRKINDLYATILEVCGDWNDPDFCAGYALFMGSIMASKRPLSLAALRALHGGKEEHFERLPQRFGSLLMGLHAEHEPIHTLHLSFREFVTVHAAERAETQKFFLSQKEYSQRLAELCLRTMVREMTAAPITGTGYLAKIADGRLGIPKLTGVSEQLLYGCEHWGHHICDIEKATITVTEIIQKFLPHHHNTSIEIVASASTYAGSLSVWHWAKNHGPELAKLYDATLPSQAKALLNLSNRLEDAGRLEEALTAIEESVCLRRALAAQQSAKASAKICTSLHALLGHWSSFGWGKVALNTTQQAPSPAQNVATEQPGTFDADLGYSLHSLSNCLSNLGRREEALTVIQEAVQLHRILAIEQSVASNANLASSLGTLSYCLTYTGRREEALTTIQEAASLYRALAVERTAAFNVEYARLLNNLSSHLSNLGRTEEALTVMQEVISLHRTLAAEHPAYFNANLALSLSNLSNCLSRLGRHKAALKTIEEAVALYQSLMAKRPKAFKPDLARSLNNLSQRFLYIGQREKALAASQEAVGLYRTLAAERPAVFNASLAQSLFNLSVNFTNLSHYEEALASIQESADLYKDLVAQWPNMYTSGLAYALRWLSQCQSNNQRKHEAKGILPEADG
ncbi:hypothetical protein HWV62_19445 [Athelia sp. TMB]|nr:hypothetical protein HWV62_19445 [Athelia sp. TMB]